MSRLSGAKGRRNRSVSVYELPDHQDQDASLRWAHRRSGQMGVLRMKQIQTQRSNTPSVSSKTAAQILGVVGFMWIAMVGTPSSAAAGLNVAGLGIQMDPDHRVLNFVDMRPWYDGGTLHSVTVRTWSRSTPRNQLATASAWVIHLLGEPRVRQIGMSGVRVRANGLVTCINTAIGPEVMSQPVTNLAEACAILMNM